MKTVAIMQPYLFPYIGYFQLVNEVDAFVLYDDVAFIRRGWINRNYIQSNGKPSLFTIPVSKVPLGEKINTVRVSIDEKWKLKFLKRITREYSKSANFSKIMPIIQRVVETDSNLLVDWVKSSLSLINEYLGIETEIVISSEVFANQNLKSTERILDICRIMNAERYINPIGGLELYDPGEFRKNGIDLRFIYNQSRSYDQFGSDFIPNLSIIDVMMFCDKVRILKMLKEFKLE
jgi:hypothetical protein